MKSSEKISVIIPIYNTEKYIARCLETVLSNTYRNIEVLCINDGSTDSSLSILEKYAAKDQRIKIINQKNAGVSAARNAGLNAVTGDYVTFVDSDDWVHPLYFETLLYFQKKTNASVASCMWESVTYEVPQFLIFNKNHITYKVLKKEEILKNNVAKRLACGHLYSAKLLNQHYFEPNLKNEEDIFYNISLVCKHPDITMVVIDMELYFYYQRLTSASHINTWKERIRISQKYLESIKTLSRKEEQRIYLIEACKSVLALRYASTFSYEHKAIKVESKKIMRCCKKNMRQLDNISLSELLIYSMFFCFPCIYRLFRIIDDPTLLDWEHREKEKIKKGETGDAFF